MADITRKVVVAVYVRQHEHPVHLELDADMARDLAARLMAEADLLDEQKMGQPIFPEVRH